MSHNKQQAQLSDRLKCHLTDTNDTQLSCKHCSIFQHYLLQLSVLTDKFFCCRLEMKLNTLLSKQLQRTNINNYYYYYYIHLTAFFQGNLGKLAPERQTILDFSGARDDEVAVASAGPYANHLHRAPDR